MVMLHLRGHDVALFSKSPRCTVLAVLDGMKARTQQSVRDAVHPEQRSLFCYCVPWPALRQQGFCSPVAGLGGAVKWQDGERDRVLQYINII
eukprot:2293333-Alexandrium_andersonii.AAC.1